MEGPAAGRPVRRAFALRRGLSTRSRPPNAPPRKTRRRRAAGRCWRGRAAARPRSRCRARFQRSRADAVAGEQTAVTRGAAPAEPNPWPARRSARSGALEVWCARRTATACSRRSSPPSTAWPGQDPARRALDDAPADCVVDSFEVVPPTASARWLWRSRGRLRRPATPDPVAPPDLAEPAAPPGGISGCGAVGFADAEPGRTSISLSHRLACLLVGRRQPVLRECRPGVHDARIATFRESAEDCSRSATSIDRRCTTTPTTRNCATRCWPSRRRCR